MEIFLLALVTVAVAEIGDNTQFVSLALSARFRKPWPVLAGVAAASIANHGLAAVAGLWVARLLPENLIVWIVGLGFLLMTAWTLRGGHEGDHPPEVSVRGAFVTTFVLSYHEDSAGGLMNPDQIAVRADIKVGTLLRYLRLLEDLPPNTDKFFIVDRDNCYQGIVRARRVLTTFFPVRRA